MKHHISRFKSLCALTLALAMLGGCSAAAASEPMAYDESELYLETAIQSGNAEFVQECIENGVDLDSVGSGLFQLIKRDWITEVINMQSGDTLRMVKILLEGGADVNRLDINGLSPMLRACGADENGYYDSSYVELFMQYKGDINKKSRDGHTPIDYALQNWDLDTVELLLDWSCEITEETLILAQESFVDTTDCSLLRRITEQAVKNGVDTGLYDIIEAALLGDSAEVIQLADNIGDADPTLLLNYTAAFCTPEAMQALIENEIAYENALSIAAENGNLPMIEYLIGIGMNVNGLDSYSYTPLYNAVYSGHTDAAELLFRYGASIEDRTSESYQYGMDLAENAAYDANIDMMKLLSAHGLYLNDKNRFTLIHDAVTDNGAPVIDFLLTDISLPAYRDELTEVLETACDYGYPDIAQLVIEKGANVNGIFDKGAPLFYAVENGDIEIARLLVEKGAKVDIIHKNGENALITATRYGYFDIVRLLADSGANLNLISDNDGSTALMAAAQTSAHILQYLIERGAYLNSQNDYGETALMLAVTARLKTNAVLLLAARANTALRNGDGMTAWDIAASEGNRVMTALLANEISDV